MPRDLEFTLNLVYFLEIFDILNYLDLFSGFIFLSLFFGRISLVGRFFSNIGKKNGGKKFPKISDANGPGVYPNLTRPVIMKWCFDTRPATPPNPP